MVRIDDFIKSHLVLTGWRYGQLYGQGGHLVSTLVMSCIANRQKKGWGEWFQIISSIPKYAAEIESPGGFPEVWEPSFIRLLHEVEGIYDGSVKDIACGGVYWGDLRKIETPFFKDVILGQKELHPRAVDMNSFSVWK